MLVCSIVLYHVRVDNLLSVPRSCNWLLVAVGGEWRCWRCRVPRLHFSSHCWSSCLREHGVPSAPSESLLFIAFYVCLFWIERTDTYCHPCWKKRKWSKVFVARCPSCRQPVNSLAGPHPFFNHYDFLTGKGRHSLYVSSPTPVPSH